MFSTVLFEPWQHYHTHVVRQLAFAIASPNLIRYFPAQITPTLSLELHPDSAWQNYYWAYQPRLHYLDQHPEELINFLSRIKSTRLGLRFEALLWFWLQDSCNQYFELLGHSIQYHHKGKTLGEIDFLVRDLKTQHVEHWEVCLKYYLAEYDLDIHTWIGLNPEDTFEHKLNHLAHKQFQFKDALGHVIQARKVVIKGQLFLPISHANIPTWLNTSRRLGIWLDKIPPNKQLVWLSRQEWLCPEAKISLCAREQGYFFRNGLYYNYLDDKFTMLRLKSNFILLKT